jgi:SpoVK/Ycf46/Vps4 family AAA+-type ATPase
MRFKNYIKAGFPILWIKTSEEQRALLDCVSQIRRESTQYKFYSWDVVDGVRERKLFTGDLTADKAIEGTENAPMAPLKWLEDNSEVNSIMFLLDYHAFLDKEFQDSTVLKRKLRNVYDRFKAEGMSLVIIANSDDIPLELEKQITLIDYDLPNKDELKLLLRDLCVALDREYPDDDSMVISAAQGLTLIEAENAFALSYQETRTFDADIILREKATIVKKSGALTVVSTRCSVDEIGSMEMLKAWLSTRSECFTDEAKQFGIKPPRALLLAGDPGCGKSLAVKAIAAIWNRILLRMDIGDLLGGIVGESEAKTKRVLAMAEAMAPCVLWWDEMEKLFAGSKSDQGSHEVSRHILQIILTWMQERTADVFIAATANALKSLPPELLRRFDAKFWVSLPDDTQRKEILSIHLKKVDRSIDMFTDHIPALVEACDGFSGAEIETWVGESLVHAFHAQHEDLQIEDLLETVTAIAPMSVISSEDLIESRRWAMTHGIRSASITHMEPTTAPARAMRRRVISQ